MQSDGGDIVPPPRFLKGLETICRKHGILLLVDEVKIGFGRSGHIGLPAGVLSQHLVACLAGLNLAEPGRGWPIPRLPPQS